MCGTLALLLPQPTPLPLARARLLRALATLQHRGQAGYGFAYATEGTVVAEVHAGLVPAVDASPPPPPDAPTTRFLLGHVRYPTSAAGARDGLAPLQPLTGTHPVLGPFALAHNGNIPSLDGVGVGGGGGDGGGDAPPSTPVTDTMRVRDFLQTVATAHDRASFEEHRVEAWLDALAAVATHVRAVYSLLVLTPTAVFALRDPYGVRPLCVAEVPAGEGEAGPAVMYASETVAFPPGATDVRHAVPGTCTAWWHDGAPCLASTVRVLAAPNPHPCVFEMMYYASPGHVGDLGSVEAFRRQCGAALARAERVVGVGGGGDERPMANDDWERVTTNGDCVARPSHPPVVVVGSPNSGIAAGQGYAEARGWPYVQALVRNPHFRKRSFLEPDTASRLRVCREKFVVDAEAVLRAGLPWPLVTVVLVDDSMVRGNTMRVVLHMFREAGVADVHVRLASPPVWSPCRYGIHIPTRDELVIRQTNGDLEALALHVGATSVRYLTMEDVERVVEGKPHCAGCFGEGCGGEALGW